MTNDDYSTIGGYVHEDAFTGHTTDALDELLDAYNDRLEKELRGAWRAGYNYLHVYAKRAPTDVPSDMYSIRNAVLPTDVERLPEPEGWVYEHTYDIGGVPDDVVRRMLEQQAGIPADASDE